MIQQSQLNFFFESIMKMEPKQLTSEKLQQPEQFFPLIRNDNWHVTVMIESLFISQLVLSITG